ncbi:hypothetical protein CPIN17262_0451 [Campylobacter pinnipediorum subsp. pinnipediorum]|nr:hypothetical protein CPIN17262_0451 [Campylobacter pinnipediorum subsp. pinnipediorum]
MLKYFLSLALCILFSGCAFLNTKAQPLQKKIVVKKVKKMSTIKGYITELSYDGGKYCYQIVATDTSNLKLSNASFCSAKFYHNKGDLVYATFYGDNIKEMLLIRPKIEEKKIKRTFKNRKNIISVPREEKISFD